MTDQIDAATADEIQAMLSEDTQAEPQDLGTDAPAAADAQEGQDEPSEPAPKKPSAQDRIDELTRLRREAERRAEAAEAALAAAKQQKDDSPALKEDAEPDPNDYTYGETDAAYIRALARYEAKQEFRQQAQKQAAETEARSLEQTWEQRQQAFAKEKPDYKEVVHGREWSCTPVMADAIKTSDDGAAVAYHLATNPDEARRIAALNPISQVRELGRIEARLSASAAPAATPTKTVSDAPAPAPQLRGQSGRFSVAPDTDDLAAFEAEFLRRG